MKYKKVNTICDGSPEGLPPDILFRPDSGIFEQSCKPINLTSYPYYTPSVMPGQSTSSATSPVTNLDIRGFTYQPSPYYNNLPSTSLDAALTHRQPDNPALTSMSHQQKYISNNNGNYTAQHNGGQYSYPTHYYSNSSN